MFFHFKALFFTVLFAVVLELAAFRNEQIIFFVLVLLSITMLGIRNITKKSIFFVIPITLSLSSVAMLYLIDAPTEKHIFSALSSIMYYLSFLGIYRLHNYAKDQTARGMMAASATASLFFFYASFYGIYLNFSISIGFMMFFYFLVTAIVSYEYFMIYAGSRRRVLIYSLILGVLMAEIAWVTSFWPFGYLTTGVITLIFYYTFWDLTQTNFLNMLSQKRLVVSLFFFIFMISVVLATSKWLPTS